VRRCAVSAIGRDRPGIVAAVTRILLDLGANIEDSQMAILRGHFSMMLVVALPENAETDAGDDRLARLREQLAGVGDELGLEAISAGPIADLEGNGAGTGVATAAGGAGAGGGAAGTGSSPSHILTVYGADHPGIVHTVSAALAKREISITGLETKLAGDAEPLYVMSIEIAAAGADATELREALEATAAEAGLELSLRELEDTAL